jgi:putative transposase
MNRNLHHPPHIFVDDSWYFITAHTIGHDSPLKDSQAKKIWTEKLYEIADIFDFKIHVYVVLDDHYHFLGYITDSKRLPKLINRLHGTTSFFINKLNNTPGRRIWHNYWDRVIRDEAEFYTKMNYIHYNPVKHGYVRDPEKWEFSTYHDFILENGEEWMWDCRNSYPIMDCDFEN